MSANHIILREPYRFFFPVGIMMGWIGVSPWILYAAHVKDSYSMMFHSSTQIMLYVPCFIIGFLTTFIPRFTRTEYLSFRSLFRWREVFWLLPYA